MTRAAIPDSAVLCGVAKRLELFLGSERKNSKSKRVASDSRRAAPSKQRSAGKLNRNFQEKEKRKTEETCAAGTKCPLFHMFHEEWTKKLHCLSFSFIHFETIFHPFMILVFIQT